MDNSKELEFYTPKFFKWEKIATSLQKSTLMKVKTEKQKYKPRFIGLYYNYLIFFEPGKTKKEPTDKNAEAKSVLPLEKVTDTSKMDLFKDKEGYSFNISAGEDSCSLCSENESVAIEWIQTIKNTIEKIKRSERRMSNDEALSKLNAIQLILPENLKVMNFVNPEEGEKYINDMKKYRDEYKKSGPYIHSLALYGEYQTGRVKGYHTWFTNPTKGCLAQLNTSEECVMRDWEEKIKKSA